MFRNKNNEIKLEKKALDRLEVVKARFANRRVKLIFTMMAANSSGLIEARKKFKKILLRQQHQYLKYYLSLWNRSKNAKKEKARERKIMMLAEEIQS